MQAATMTGIDATPNGDQGGSPTFQDRASSRAAEAIVGDSGPTASRGDWEPDEARPPGMQLVRAITQPNLHLPL